MARSQSGESVMERVLRILEAFDAHNPVLTASDIARRADLPVTTAYRLVSELLELRLLERTEGRGIRVGVRIWELATRSSRVMRLRDVALPFMDDLHASYGSTLSSVCSTATKCCTSNACRYPAR